MFSLYKSRKAVACLLPAGLVVLVIYASQLQRLQIKPVYDESTVEIALVDAAELLAAAEPVPEPPVEPEPAPAVIEPEVPEPVVIEPPQPKPVPKPVVKPKAPAPKPLIAQPAPPKPAPPVVTKAAVPVSAPAPAAAPVAPKPQAPVAVPSAPNNAARESLYTSALRKELEKHKQYPSGREASLQRPHGDVVIWLEVDRDGNVLDSGIENKAPNMLLNRAAQTSLRRLEKVSPFPSDAFSGKSKQRFTATFSYNVE